MRSRHVEEVFKNGAFGQGRKNGEAVEFVRLDGEILGQKVRASAYELLAEGLLEPCWQSRVVSRVDGGRFVRVG